MTSKWSRDATAATSCAPSKAAAVRASAPAAAASAARARTRPRRVPKTDAKWSRGSCAQSRSISASAPRRSVASSDVSTVSSAAGAAAQPTQRQAVPAATRSAPGSPTLAQLAWYARGHASVSYTHLTLPTILLV